jgi:hypothetical protein
MREARVGRGNVIPGEALDVGHVWSVGSRISDRCLIRIPRRWKRPVGGVEGVLVQGVRHTRRPSVRRDYIYCLQ